MHQLSRWRAGRSRAACAAAIACAVLAAGTTAQAAANNKITLTLWYESQGPGYTTGFNAATAAWNKAHPDIQVVPVGKATTALADQEPLALKTGVGPCIPESWQLGYGTLGRMVKDKSLLPLDKYATQYGWAKQEGSSLLQQARFTPDGATWGKGSLYGLPIFGGALGLFYNKQKLQALNIGVPKTFQQFLSDLALAKKAGQVPLILGDAQGFPLLHDFQLFVNSFGGASAWKNFVYGVGHPNGTFSSAAVLQGAGVVVKLGSGGLVNSDHAGTQLLDMVSRFTKGQGVFMITGTWFVSTVQTAMKSNVGFAVMPSANGQPPATNGTGTPWGISAACKYPDQAAQFLNYLISPAVTAMFLKTGGFPVVPMTNAILNSASITPTSAAGQAFTMFDREAKLGNFLPFLDWTTPSMLQTADANLELLISGKQTPQQFAAAVQSDYNSYWQANG